MTVTVITEGVTTICVVTFVSVPSAIDVVKGPGVIVVAAVRVEGANTILHGPIH